jgi:hypothetical protein
MIAWWWVIIFGVCLADTIVSSHQNRINLIKRRSDYHKACLDRAYRLYKFRNTCLNMVIARGDNPMDYTFYHNEEEYEKKKK